MTPPPEIITPHAQFRARRQRSQPHAGRIAAPRVCQCPELEVSLEPVQRVHHHELHRRPSKRSIATAPSFPVTEQPHPKSSCTLGYVPARTRDCLRVTRAVVTELAALARELHGLHRDRERVAKFVLRCVFTMFAEGVGLLPEPRFARALESRWLPDPPAFAPEVEAYWHGLNVDLFAHPEALPLARDQLLRLHALARTPWPDVDPVVLGTLLESALDPAERRRLGAHFTPRAYVERLVRYTIEEPLRDEWEVVRAEALAHAARDDLPGARRATLSFLWRLSTTCVLDPACGTGNFLYITFEALKRLEADVLSLHRTFPPPHDESELTPIHVTPQQLRGIELKPWACEIAELVLWIGAMQWPGPPAPPFRAPGRAAIVRHQDALLDGDRPASWPTVDFIVGNPPFLGKSRLRACLGDAYVTRLRAAYPAVPEGADLVMYWWHRAAQLLRNGLIKRFGFVTTNSITQIYNRRVLGKFLRGEPPIHLTHAIPDHPWLDTEHGAAVRIAMTVAARGAGVGRRLHVIAEGEPDPDDGAAAIESAEETGVIHEDLRVGPHVGSALPLAANRGLAGAGVMLGGRGFLVLPGDSLYRDTPHVRPLVHGRDLLQTARRARVIDFADMTEAEATRASPAAFARVLAHVKPVRDHNGRPTRRAHYWQFSEVMPATRRAIAGLSRYIVTPETAKHRVFFFVPGDTLPEHPLLAIGVDDAFVLAVLSSRAHVVWALHAGGTLADRPRYNKTVCFENFPFPECPPDLRAELAALGEQLDQVHRALVELPGATITKLYNILARPASASAKTPQEHALAAALRAAGLAELRARLDAAVLAAYGLPRELPDDALLRELVALNHRRAADEQSGRVLWLRPQYQAPTPAG